MVEYLRGNLLEAPVEALVNTVNTVGVMGKGIALMFKDAFPKNARAYEAACRRGEVEIGRMFVTEQLTDPRWLINFPTKKHWRQPSKLEWIVAGLKDLRRVIQNEGISSIALPPLGCGNGGLNWKDVRPQIERALGDLGPVQILVFEPTPAYLNVAKLQGTASLTPARALVVESIRRYSVIDLGSTVLEVQKLGYFLERACEDLRLPSPLQANFSAHLYGPYSERIRHLLNDLEGGFLRCEKRLADAGPTDEIYFEHTKHGMLDEYLKSVKFQNYTLVFDWVDRRVDGFQSPLGMELLATVDWLIRRENCQPEVRALREGLENWPAGKGAGKRKLRLFDDRMLGLALERLNTLGDVAIRPT